MQRIPAQIATWFAAIVALIGIGYFSLYYASPFARSWDEVDFALALDRFDLLAMQPHFPGYPYFIIGGTLVHHWIADPVKALATFNAAMALSSAVPIYLLARRHVNQRASLLIAALVLTTPYLWLMTARPMSECAGIALLWWFLWSVRQAMEYPRSKAWHALTLVFFGLLMGTRLSFFPFGTALLLLWAYKYKSNAGTRGRKVRLLLSVISACLIQLVWVAGLALSEGTLSGFVKLSMAFVKGHFTEWGGGVVSISMPFGRRAVQLFGNNLLGDVLLSRSIVIGILLALLLVLVWMRHRLISETSADEPEHLNRLFRIGIIICLSVYAAWALLGQNIEKPRHIAPIAGPMLFLVYLSAIRTAVFGLSRIIPMILSLILVAQFVQGAMLLKRQAEQIPAVYQLHDYLSHLDAPFVVYTWEETRVFQYLKATYEHRDIVTYDYFKAVARASSGQRVLLTDKVLRGFELQDSKARDHVVQLSEFKSDSLFDPVYGRIILYEWSENL
ncbi:glycosyltransferase family 39 protein [Cohnella luojiensis]|uniref:Glycosyltransferase RgtA/B/C/D-like domain-containing protein n=1 Tax=Cohnella luojiensis TaxID=652876 RepID=A0A4Y8LVA2_9BACL|nr:glycosyltransferase family 39 protein [Cohnella luojiensis]TFE25014.1 hypothetical protein E2980_14760 [Cohnella luojiensis]